MNDAGNHLPDLNRRDFLKGGSAATLMTMMGGVPLVAADPAAPAETKRPAEKIKVGLIGLGSWGRDLINVLNRVETTDLAAICDTYPAALRRNAEAAPHATQTSDYKTILANKDIRAVIIATPTHLHKEIAVAALSAGKHVYCEVPLAHTIEDARAIALAAKAAKTQVFQSGLQLRSDKQHLFLLPFIRSGALGPMAMARAQWHKKRSWRATAPNEAREKELNWRLNKAISLGLIGEVGCHQIDQANWFLNAKPVSVTGVGSIVQYNDGRDVPDTIHALIEYPGGVYLNYDATLANSFDLNYEVFYGAYSAIMLRDDKAWLFKEVDSPLLGWEVYASKERFYKEAGIALVADASKSVKKQLKPEDERPVAETITTNAVKTFLNNSIDVEQWIQGSGDLFKVDPDGAAEEIAKLPKGAAAGYVEGFQSTVVAIKANEAIMGGKRVELKHDLYELS